MCSVPGCGKVIVPTSRESEHGMCRKHDEWLTFLLFALPKIKVQTAARPVLTGRGGIVPSNHKTIILPAPFTGPGR